MNPLQRARSLGVGRPARPAEGGTPRSLGCVGQAPLSLLTPGRIPPGVNDAQAAHDEADVMKRGAGSGENHPRGAEWMRTRVGAIQEERLDALFGTSMKETDE